MFLDAVTCRPWTGVSRMSCRTRPPHWAGCTTASPGLFHTSPSRTMSNIHWRTSSGMASRGIRYRDSITSYLGEVTAPSRCNANIRFCR